MPKDPRQVVMEAICQNVGRQIASELEDTTTGPAMGFILLVFDFGDHSDKFTAYMSNAQREGQIKILREHLAKLEGRTN
jgi:hypothetical protein